jgi:hypothetical protein
LERAGVVSESLKSQAVHLDFTDLIKALETRDSPVEVPADLLEYQPRSIFTGEEKFDFKEHLLELPTTCTSIYDPTQINELSDQVMVPLTALKLSARLNQLKDFIAKSAHPPRSLPTWG